MIIGCWNVRGLNQPLKQHGIYEFLIKNKVDIMGLLETKLNQQALDRMMANKFKHWMEIDNFHTHQGGRIVIMWDPQKYDIQMLECCSQVIHCEIFSKCTKEKFHLSCVYGHNNLAKRRGLWNSLMNWAGGIVLPWMCMGDFNNMLRTEERRSGRPVTQHEIKDMQECCEVSGLMDVNSTGLFYTWSNGSVWSKLDRVMVGPSWPQHLVHINALFIPPGFISDHAASLTTIAENPSRGKKIFKFMNIWADHEEFNETVLNNWHTNHRGCEMFKLCKKLKSLKKPLKNLNYLHFSHIKERVVRAEEELLKLQRCLHDNPEDANLVQYVSSCKAATTKIKEAEQSFYLQKAKVRHVFNTDKGTKYFHALMRRRTIRNHISSITLSNGQKTTNMEQVQDAFVDHFRGLLGSRSSRTNIDVLVLDEGPKITTQQGARLTEDVSELEIRAALFSIGNDKAPGPDGYNSLFFKKMWQNLKGDIIMAVKEFFLSGKILRQINHSLIALIPKSNNPEKVGDYRPIACCNVIYKIIAKILASRLAPILMDVINPAQAAFIQKRNMSDNIYLVQELVRKYCRKRISPRCMIKIDLLKAYDLVEWSFLEEILAGLCFPDKFIRWVMQCVGTTSFSIVINGSTHGHFEGRRGLRQGDPLSPFLFVICLEYFSRSLSSLKNTEFNYHPKCKPNEITHLAFADDLILFARGDIPSIELLMERLQDFGASSGLQASLSKSNLFTAGLQSNDMDEIRRITGLEVGNFPFRFLGIPLAAMRLTASQFSPFIEKITEKISVWTGATLTYAGRLELINAVLRGVEGFWLSIFPIPATVANRIISLCRAFLWGGNASNRKKPLVAWSNICMPKLEGGLGIVNLSIWNKALMMKNLWNIHDKKDTLWVKWISHFYLKGKTIWDAPLNREDSPLLKSLANLKDLILAREVTIPIAERTLESWVKDGDICIKKVYDYLRPKQPTVGWAQLVWSKDLIPKHSFILWLGMKGRLLTKDKLHLEEDEKLCPLCRMEEETVNHIFFKCLWVTSIWKDIRQWLGIRRNMSTLASTAKWFRKEIKGKSSHVKAKRIATACFVYNIWDARNKIIFEGKKTTASDISARVKTHVFRALPDW
jgi:hypothetical protein